MEHTYIAIDLKSFYASVECVDRGLDPLNTNLVVADLSRTEKTICLAVTPSLKAYGISGRARLFEVIESVRQVNEQRLSRAGAKEFSDSCVFKDELDKNHELKLDYIIAPPRMALYQQVSSEIFSIYLKYVSHEDIHVYSIDEVFMDVTGYLSSYHGSAHEMAVTIIRDVLKQTGITATAGIGTNLYLCKVAMDVVAKRMPPDKDGVRIAYLDERLYRKLLWDHRPMTDLWRLGSATAAKLEANGMHTIGDVARMSLSEFGEKRLYKLFGVHAELLIDHAWGYEPCVISDIRSYQPEVSSISEGQVLKEPTDNPTTRLILWEMADILAMQLMEKQLVTRQITLTVGYDRINLQNQELAGYYRGDVKKDHYGRKVPAHSHGTENLEEYSCCSGEICAAVMRLFDRITSDTRLLSRRLCLCACDVKYEREAAAEVRYEQLDLFTDITVLDREREARQRTMSKQMSIQRALLEIKRRYGKNSILRAKNFLEGGTAIERNGQIGGHQA